MEAGTVVTVAIFAAGVIYQVGRQSQRINQLEAAVAKLETAIGQLGDELRGAALLRPWSRGH